MGVGTTDKGQDDDNINHHGGKCDQSDPRSARSSQAGTIDRIDGERGLDRPPGAGDRNHRVRSGAHRIAAAHRIGIDIPVLLIESETDWTVDYSVDSEYDRMDLVHDLGDESARALLSAEGE